MYERIKATTCRRASVSFSKRILQILSIASSTIWPTSAGISFRSTESSEMARLTLSDDRRDIAGRATWLKAIVGPRLHQPAPLLEQVATLIGLLNLITDDMGQCGLGQLAREVRVLRRPCSKGRTEAVRRNAVAHCSQHRQQRHIR